MTILVFDELVIIVLFLRASKVATNIIARRNNLRVQIIRRFKRSESVTHFTSSLSIAVGIHTVLISVSVLNAEDDNAPVLSGYGFTSLTC